MGPVLARPPKGTFLRGNTLYIWIVTIGTPPTLSQSHKNWHVWAYPRRSNIFQVLSKSVQGFRPPRGRNLPFPITLPNDFYNRLYYTVQAVTKRKLDYLHKIYNQNDIQSSDNHTAWRKRFVKRGNSFRIKPEISSASGDR